MRNKFKKILKQTTTAALKAVRGDLVVKKYLSHSAYGQYCNQHCYLIAIGKAAEAMSLGAVHQLGGAIKSGLIISKQGHFNSYLLTDKRFQCLEAGHPVPNLASLKAGQALLQYIQQLPEDAHCLFLISGGTSSLVEVLEAGWTLTELQQVTQYLLANAYSIDEINAVRCYISKIKAGGLWHSIKNRQVTCLMISDVAGDDPAVIGSGLLFPSTHHVPATLPEKWRSRFHYSQPIKSKNLQWKIIATLDDAKQAAASIAIEQGYHVKIDPNFLQGDAEQVAKSCVQQLQHSDADMIVWGGETTVNLPNNAPIGGRNQHFALAVAILIAKKNYAFICMGTDGSDGTSHVAGGLVNGQTVQYGEKKGLSAQKYLQQANAHAFLSVSNALISTGATGTNVMDLIIGIKEK